MLWFAFEKREVHDVDIAFAYFMLALTFPVSALAQGLIFLSNTEFGLPWPNGFLGNFCFWVIAVGLGYWQWFVAVPCLFKRIKAANQKMKADGK